MIPMHPPTISQPPPTDGKKIAIEWAEAAKAAKWSDVYRLGNRFLDHSPKKAQSDPNWNRMIGFTWFAAYFETRAGRLKRDPLVCIQKAVRLIPDQNEVWYELGAEQNRQGLNKDALVSIEKYLERVPGNLDGQFEKAFALIGLHDLTTAKQVLQSLNTQSPKNPTILRELAFIQNEQGDFEAALINLLNAIEVSPNDPVTYVELAFTYRRLKRWDHSKQALDTAASLGFDAAKIEIERKILSDQRIQ